MFDRKEYDRQYYAAHRETILPRKRQYMRDHAEQRAQYTAVYRAKQKRLALLKIQRLYNYNHIPHCAHCGLTNIDALTVDHVNGYTSGPRAGLHLYRWILKNEIKCGTFQVLCHNCNRIKAQDYGSNKQLPKSYEFLNDDKIKFIGDGKDESRIEV